MCELSAQGALVRFSVVEFHHSFGYYLIWLDRNVLNRRRFYQQQENIIAEGLWVKNMCVRIFSIIVALSIYSYSLPGTTEDLSEISVKPGEYLVKAEIIMPHLEASLRYAATETRHCVIGDNVSGLFPLLSHVSFTDCALVEKKSTGAHEEFDLICLNPEAATGTAQMVVDEEVFRATLNIKMGGKNMKFSQRINGHRIGNCNE